MTRIRTAQQASEIRYGILLAKDAPIPSDEPTRTELTKLIRRAYWRTRDKPPAGVREHTRHDHPSRTKLWLTTWDGDHAHITPLNDDIGHDQRPTCICQPRSEYVATSVGDAWIHTHHSLDGRELTEPDRKQP